MGVHIVPPLPRKGPETRAFSLRAQSRGAARAPSAVDHSLICLRAFRLVVCSDGFAGLENRSHVSGWSARCALTSCMSWVNLGVIFAVLYQVATTSVAASSAARGRPAEVLRFQ